MERTGASFQSRITAVAMITAISVLALACLIFTVAQWKAHHADLEDNQAHLATILTRPIAHALEAHDAPRVQRMVDLLSASPGVETGDLLDQSGKVIARYRATRVDPSANGEMLVTTTPVVSGGKTWGQFVIRRRMEGASAVLPQFIAVAGALFFAAAAMALFLGRWLAGRVIEPVNRLSAAMSEVAESSDFGRRVERGDDDEFGRLTDSFNGLLVRLQANDQALRSTMVELVKARDAAETANIQKSQFLANMSHEIRTPLNGVLAMAQVIALGDLGQEQRERLDVIRNSGEALLAILNDILDVSKIEAGKLDLDEVDFDLESLIKGAHGGFAAVAERKGLAFILDFAPEAQGTRRGDSARLRQIISNLISNALKFTAEGEVRMSLRGLGDGGADGFALSVSDTGIGMAAEKLPLLFKKFTQLDASTTRQFGGTGLGLSICYELAHLMGGRVWAESVEGKGSTFHLELPLVRVAAAEPVVVVEDGVLPEDQGRALRILAAEDNATNQMVLSTIIQIFGAELEIVGDGAKAVEAWDIGDYDVILMDIQMPVMDGMTATSEIRRRETLQKRARTPIIALSANAMVHQIKEYLAVGMDGHVAKPIELPKLHAALEAALAAREAAMRAAA